MHSELHHATRDTTARQPASSEHHRPHETAPRRLHDHEDLHASEHAKLFAIMTEPERCTANSIMRRETPQRDSPPAASTTGHTKQRRDVSMITKTYTRRNTPNSSRS